jgi:DNA invertase Pin-like site-specific DNA recombinase
MTKVVGPKRRLKIAGLGAAHPQVYAYLRVSTGEQDVRAQQLGVLDYAKQHGFDGIKFIEEARSGAIPASERVLGRDLLPQLNAGDVLLVSEISRLGRSVVDILSTLKVCAERGVEVHVIKQNMRLDKSLNSTILTTVLSLTAEIERELIRERTREGQRKARNAGKHIGRPRLMDESLRRSKLDSEADRIKDFAAKGVNKANLARIFNCDWLTIHTWMKRHKVAVRKAA